MNNSVSQHYLYSWFNPSWKGISIHSSIQHTESSWRRIPPNANKPNNKSQTRSLAKLPNLLGIMSTFSICQSCTNDEVPTEQMLLVASGNPVCHACFNRGIKPMFIAALKNEIHHPVRQYQQKLDINDFSTFFTPEFLEAYHIKLQEYAVPITDRLYCNNSIVATQEICGHFIGSKRAQTGNSVPCNACSTSEVPIHICIRCSESFSGEPDAHSCGPSEDPLQSLTRGVDYQICPNSGCRAKIQLTEACNHIICRLCETDLCYICGEEILPAGHFVAGPCPSYGPLGAARPFFAEFRPIAAEFRPIVEVFRPYVAEPVPIRNMVQLAERHRRLLNTIDMRIWIYTFAPDISIVRDLLLTEIATVYELPQYADGPRWQDERHHRISHEIIIQIVRSFTRVVLRREAGLRVVYRTYLNAWNDRRDNQGWVILGE